MSLRLSPFRVRLSEVSLTNIRWTDTTCFSQCSSLHCTKQLTMKYCFFLPIRSKCRFTSLQKNQTYISNRISLTVWWCQLCDPANESMCAVWCLISNRWQLSVVGSGADGGERAADTALQEPELSLNLEKMKTHLESSFSNCEFSQFKPRLQFHKLI